MLVLSFYPADTHNAMNKCRIKRPIEEREREKVRERRKKRKQQQRRYSNFPTIKIYKRMLNERETKSL